MRKIIYSFVVTALFFLGTSNLKAQMPMSSITLPTSDSNVTFVMDFFEHFDSWAGGWGETVVVHRLRIQGNDDVVFWMYDGHWDLNPSRISAWGVSITYVTASDSTPRTVTIPDGHYY